MYTCKYHPDIYLKVVVNKNKQCGNLFSLYSHAILIFEGQKLCKKNRSKTHDNIAQNVFKKKNNNSECSILTFKFMKYEM